MILRNRKRAPQDTVTHAILSESNSKKPRKTKVELKDAPELNNLQDLIRISKEKCKYRNIDMSILNYISEYLMELDAMIGMKNLKESVFLQVLYYLQDFHLNNESDYLHTVICGGPGCGKTEVSKILGKIYAGLGLLSKGTFHTATRSDLIGAYLGQTAIKTTKVLRNALGGVLFIDEVYSLGNDRDDKGDSFSKECIDTINLFISENKDDFCVIIAGYEKEIENCFFSRNSGLKRRFPWVHRIDKYSNADLVEILKAKLRDETVWTIDATDDQLSSIFRDHRENFKNYGGDIETYITKVKMSHSRRVFTLPKTEKYHLTFNDFSGGLTLLKLNVHDDNQSRHIETMFM